MKVKAGDPMDGTVTVILILQMENGIQFMPQTCQSYGKKKSLLSEIWKIES